uniref:Telomeric repeat-binding factor 1 n=1 Tax=Malurus cyaneus samueli TaxID=2593467 RepID=A0A8C5T1V7_9PASS
MGGRGIQKQRTATQRRPFSFAVLGGSRGPPRGSPWLSSSPRFSFLSFRSCRPTSSLSAPVLSVCPLSPLSRGISSARQPRVCCLPEGAAAAARRRCRLHSQPCVRQCLQLQPARSRCLPTAEPGCSPIHECARSHGNVFSADGRDAFGNGAQPALGAAQAPRFAAHHSFCPADRGCGVQRISPLESALSFWTLLEREEIKLEKLHEDIHRLIQIQCVAVYMESRYFKEAAEALERLFTDSESDKPLRVKLATIIKSKDPYVPFLQSFSYSLLISKIKTYIELFTACQSVGQGASYCCVQFLSENKMSQSLIYLQSRPLIDTINQRNYFLKKAQYKQLKSKPRWTEAEDMELRLGVREFGVGNWAKILVHGNFNNRTSVMLKDRWRTLSKIEQG